MLHEKYFDDAFVLHDETNIYPHLQRMLLFDDDDENEFELIIDSANIQKNDDRKELHSNWASPKKFYKFQPLDLIRYFEYSCL